MFVIPRNGRGLWHILWAIFRLVIVWILPKCWFNHITSTYKQIHGQGDGCKEVQSFIEKKTFSELDPSHALEHFLYGTSTPYIFDLTTKEYKAENLLQSEKSKWMW